MSGPGSISAGLQWTGLTPAGFQDAFRAEYTQKEPYIHWNNLNKKSHVYTHRRTLYTPKRSPMYIEIIWTKRTVYTLTERPCIYSKEPYIQSPNQNKRNRVHTHRTPPCTLKRALYTHFSHTLSTRSLHKHTQSWYTGLNLGWVCMYV